MGWRGRIPLGSEVYLSVLCKNVHSTPTAPDAAPTMEVWSTAAKILSMPIPSIDGNFQAGLFGYRLLLGSAFAVGQYQVVYLYSLAGVQQSDQDQFEVIPGGDPNGAVISMGDFLPAVANYLIYQLDGGNLMPGKNPRY